MKKIGLIYCLIFFTSPVFGQQFLWTTVKDSTNKYVPINEVTNKVLEFYDFYHYYHDGSGYSKDGFFKMLESYQSSNSDKTRWQDLKKKISSIDSLTVIAFKSNLGKGSVITVMCITKENVNFITFSNNYEEDDIIIYHSEKEKFAKWFKTLLE
jgi:hypothetical protein